MKSYIHFSKHCFILLMIAFSISNVYANNMSVTNLSYSQVNSTVTFTLSWDHSWRNSSAVPNNWDAAWVFVKWRDCSAAASVDYTHGLVSTNTADHVFNNGVTTFEPTMRDGTAGIDASPNNTGVMLRNTTDGASASGTVSSTVTLKLTNPLPPTGTLDVRVFAIEMVFIPQGSFYPGDCNGTTCSYNSFSSASGGNAAAAQITSESSTLTIYENLNAGSNYTACAGTCTGITVAFPKGYGAFYMMKYEITQGQYADFLNCTFLQAQLNRYPGNNATNRHTITNTGNAPNIYFTPRPDRGCNFISWDDVTAYLDWAALRPLTEFEYEKACRGPINTLLYEKAWGTASGRAAQTISGTENGTETIVDLGANVTANANNTYGNSDLTPTAQTGPLRVGIFATPTTNTRMQTGAGYYGNMDLSGNVRELYISAKAGLSGNVSSSGVSDGDGQLNTSTGLHNQTNWQGSSTSNGGYIIIRGGGYTDGSNGGISTTTNIPLNVSERYNAGSYVYNTYNTTTRDSRHGGRGGR